MPSKSNLEFFLWIKHKNSVDLTVSNQVFSLTIQIVKSAVDCYKFIFYVYISRTTGCKLLVVTERLGIKPDWSSDWTSYNLFLFSLYKMLDQWLVFEMIFWIYTYTFSCPKISRDGWSTVTLAFFLVQKGQSPFGQS